MICIVSITDAIAFGPLLLPGDTNCNFRFFAGGVVEVVWVSAQILLGGVQNFAFIELR